MLLRKRPAAGQRSCSQRIGIFSNTVIFMKSCWSFNRVVSEIGLLEGVIWAAPIANMPMCGDRGKAYVFKKENNFLLHYHSNLLSVYRYHCILLWCWLGYTWGWWTEKHILDFYCCHWSVMHYKQSDAILQQNHFIWNAINNLYVFLGNKA